MPEKLHEAFGDDEASVGREASFRLLGEELVELLFGEVVVFENLFVTLGLLAQEAGATFGLVGEPIQFGDLSFEAFSLLFDAPHNIDMLRCPIACVN